MEKWHNLSSDEALQRLSSRRSGLTEGEAKERLARFGPNELKSAKKVSPWMLFLEQFKSLLIIILLIAVVLSAVIGEPIRCNYHRRHHSICVRFGLHSGVSS